jgi:hypothetical protein
MTLLLSQLLAHRQLKLLTLYCQEAYKGFKESKVNEVKLGRLDRLDPRAIPVILGRQVLLDRLVKLGRRAFRVFKGKLGQ